MQSVLRCGPADRPGDDGSLCESGGAPVPLVRIRGRSERGTRDCDDGLGRRRGRGSAGRLAGQGGEGRYRPSPPVSSFRGRSLHSRTAVDGQADCRIGPHKGTGRVGRTAVSGRDRRAVRGLGGGAQVAAASRHRRSIRTLLQRVHARDGGGGLRRIVEVGTQAALHRRHLRRRDPPQSEVRRGDLDRIEGRDPGRVLRAGERRHGRCQ